MTSLTDSPAWKALEAQRRDLERRGLPSLFAEDPRRFKKYSLPLGALLFAYSKHRTTDVTLRLVLDLAHQAELPKKIDQMFAGERIDITERRQLLHAALRNPHDRPIPVDGEDVTPAVHGVLDRMRRFSDAVRNGDWSRHTGKHITDVVNNCQEGLRVHYVSNIDATDLAQTLSGLRPDTTLFTVASKTFTTQETITNATSARQWLLDALGDRATVARHFVALSTNARKVSEFGMDANNMFEFWDWVGGRYSLWSTIGLSISCAISVDRFEQLLAGAHEIDEHFRTAPFSEHIPVIMALLAIWSHSILPYDQYLHRFAAYFQQGNMENNGKDVDRSGDRIRDYTTGPVIWGEPVTNGQHAFCQLLHQGTRLIPCDFIAPIRSHNAIGRHHDILLANFFAQTEALVKGKTADEVRAELGSPGMADREGLVGSPVVRGGPAHQLVPLPGTLAARAGASHCPVEHKIFIQAVILNINSFDQWGVELGKQLAKTILTELHGDDPVTTHDSSTNGLINYYKQHRQKETP